MKYPKVENEILRSKLQKLITITPKEKNRLVRFALKLCGKVLRQLTTIVASDTLLGRIRAEKSAGKKGRSGRNGVLRHKLWCIDRSVVRAHRCTAGGGKSDPREPEDHALGRSRGGFSTKLHLLFDGAGPPVHVALTAGQVHETTALEETLECA